MCPPRYWQELLQVQVQVQVQVQAKVQVLRSAVRLLLQARF
jgi:hypothetical protein